MADTSPGLETARLCSEFRSGNTTKQAATELADLVVTKFIGFSGGHQYLVSLAGPPSRVRAACHERLA
jgi:hypothetical protein